MNAPTPITPINIVRLEHPDWASVTVRPAFFVHCEGTWVENEPRLDWLEKRCARRFVVSLDDTQFGGDHIKLHFESDEDAVLYSAQWAGQQLYNYVTYIVSPGPKQRRSIADQREMIISVVGRVDDTREFVEPDALDSTASFSLDEAIKQAEYRNTVLVVGSLTDLVRHADRLQKLLAASCKIVFADLPQVNGSALRLLSVIQKWRSVETSSRVTAALAKAKREGKVLGGDRGNLAGVSEQGRTASAEKRHAVARDRARLIEPVILEAEDRGLLSFQRIADYLNAKGVRTAKGAQWTPTAVSRVKQHLVGGSKSLPSKN